MKLLKILPLALVILGTLATSVQAKDKHDKDNDKYDKKHDKHYSSSDRSHYGYRDGNRYGGSRYYSSGYRRPGVSVSIGSASTRSYYREPVVVQRQTYVTRGYSSGSEI